MPVVAMLRNDPVATALKRVVCADSAASDEFTDNKLSASRYSVPIEVFRLVFRYLEDDLRTLLACSYVCSAFQHFIWANRTSLEIGTAEGVKKLASRHSDYGEEVEYIDTVRFRGASQLVKEFRQERLDAVSREHNLVTNDELISATLHCAATLHTLRLINCPHLTEEAFGAISHCENLRSLEVRLCPLLSDAVLADVSDGLRELVWDETPLGPALVVLCRFSALQSLVIRNCLINVAHLNAIGQLTKVRKVLLHAVQAKHAFEFTSRLLYLEDLTVMFHWKTGLDFKTGTDQCLARLEDLRHLKVSRIYPYDKDEWTKFMRLVGSLTQLKTLRLTQCCRHSDADIAHIANIKRLNHLDLSFDTSLTDAALQHLAQMPLLKTVNVRGCPQVTVDAFKGFASPDLVVLSSPPS